MRDETHMINLMFVRDILEESPEDEIVERLAQALTSRDRRIAALSKTVSDMSWERDGGDRMGGSFSTWETNRRGDEWS